ncbi:MAG: hypothetical protein WKH64_18300 [Chloroflexia bacterium]
MTRSKLSIPIIVLVVVAASLLFGSIGWAGKSAAQDAEKSLDIERHQNEPLELVDIKVSGQSVKDKIKAKNRKGDHGLDNAKFTDKDDWFRRVTIKFRNVSNKPIVGIRAKLHFKPSGLQTSFGMQLGRFKQLQQEPLQPGEEIDFTVDNQLWNQTASILKRYGVDANLAAVSFSVDNVMFSDGLQWDSGHILHRDPDDPNKWTPMDKVSPQISRFDHSVQFTRANFKWGERLPQVNSRCVTNGGYIATHCSENSYCYTVERLGGGPGTQSIFPKLTSASS